VLHTSPLAQAVQFYGFSSDKWPSIRWHTLRLANMPIQNNRDIAVSSRIQAPEYPKTASSERYAPLRWCNILRRKDSQQEISNITEHDLNAARVSS